jgi:RNase P subunit RPR2
MKNISKTEAGKEIKKFFEDVENKTPKEIRKIKNLAMSYNLPLKDLKKKFCKECFAPYSGEEKVRIKNKIKSVECLNCNKISRWKMK